MSARGTFRAALQTSLAAALSMEFQAGAIEGPQADRDIGCVWWEGKRPMRTDGNEEENYYRVRVFRRWRQDQGGEEPRTTVADHLEQVAEDLEAALRAVLTTTGHQFFTVTEVTADYRTQAIDAQLVAYDRNRSAAGG